MPVVPKIIQNKFSKNILSQIIKVIQLINFNQPLKLIIQEIEILSSNNYLWAIAIQPAYFIQYQVDSYAIFNVNQYCLIVWCAKFIEYPSMIKFPELKQKNLKKIEIIVDKQYSNVLQNTQKKTIELLQNYYGTYYHTDNNFQTNMITILKNYISKITMLSYWHCLMDDHQRIMISRAKQMKLILKLRIKGAKQNYDKDLYLFSSKGSRQGIIRSLKMKWMQIVSFVAMLTIFIMMVSCDTQSQEQNKGICSYKQQAMIFGAGILLSLIGIKAANKKKNKKKTL